MMLQLLKETESDSDYERSNKKQKQDQNLQKEKEMYIKEERKREREIMRNTETIEVTSCCQQEQGKESKKGTNKNKNQPKKITDKKK